MKRLLTLTLCAMLLLCSCGGNSTTAPTQAPKTEETTLSAPVTTAETTAVTTTAKETATITTAATTEEITVKPEKTERKYVLPEESDLSALDLVGYKICDNGKYQVVYDNRTYLDNYDIYRKYFFGEWCWERRNGDDYLYIDDSEKDPFNNIGTWGFGGYGLIGENVIFFERYGNASAELFWVDINEPDIMYFETYHHENADTDIFELYFEDGTPYKTNYYTKTETPVNHPEESFLSYYKLSEMSRDYGIDFNMLVNIDYDYEKGNPPSESKYLYHSGHYEFYPVYLVSESVDKLVFKTKVGNVMEQNSEIDTTYTIEKVGSEWVRTVEFSD
ncbi:MAG: hypothetical protein ACI4J7_10975 [Ruminiclostridium sp.]